MKVELKMFDFSNIMDDFELACFVDTFKVMEEDFEGIYKFKFFVPAFYIISWSLMIFGSIFFPQVYQTICIVILVYSLLKNIGLIIGGIYALCKFYSILNSGSEDQKTTKQTIQTNSNHHAIIIPNYKEEVELLQETLNILERHHIAKTQYLIFLAMEAHEKGAQEKASLLIQKYNGKFKYMGFSLHQVRKHQAKGKASNVSWCVEHMMDQLKNLSIQQNQIMLTIIDADSWAPEEYFQTINRKVKENPELFHKAMFSAPQIYTRNNLEVPIISRVYDIMHSFVHLSNLAALEFRFPLSNYSLSYSLIKSVNFWDTCADAIGQDFHTCLKCYWKKGQEFVTVPILTAFNQLSLTTGEGYCKDMKARFWQAQRHTRGVSDAAYCLNMLFKSPFRCLNFFMTLSALEVFLLAAIIPWALLSLGIHYKLVTDESYHYYPMLMIDILLNLPLGLTVVAYVFYEIFKRRTNSLIYYKENQPLWRVIEYPIFFVFALFGYSLVAFIISSFGILCSETEYRVAEKVITKEKEAQNQGQNNMEAPSKNQDKKENPQSKKENPEVQNTKENAEEMVPSTERLRVGS